MVGMDVVEVMEVVGIVVVTVDVGGGTVVEGGMLVVGREVVGTTVVVAGEALVDVARPGVMVVNHPAHIRRMEYTTHSNRRADMDTPHSRRSFNDSVASGDR